MFGIIKRVLSIAEEFAIDLKLAFVFGFFEGVFGSIPILAILYILNKMIDESISMINIGVSIGIVLIGMIGRYIFKRLIYSHQNNVSYKIFARERLRIGERLKRFPMGYFNEGNSGNVSAVITSDLTFIEMMSMSALEKVVNGYVSVIIGCILLLFIDYRIALISIGVIILALLILNKIQKVGKKQSYIRQNTQSELVAVILAYIQGISVIKAFNLTGNKSKATKSAFKNSRDNNIEYEKKFLPPNVVYEIIFYIGITLTIFCASYFYLKGSLSLAIALMMIIYVFQFYIPLKLLGGITGQIRVMEAGLDRYDALKNTEIIDKDGKDIKLDRFDIEFKNVTFAYEEKEILKDISFKIPENSMTALVGSSGCGKTTIANLIARFWDVQKGEVLVGGVNVKEMNCDGLLKNMSMVFQKVYLFNDTIYNNVKFGKADATKEEIIAACKKARCHEFVMELENDYDTMVGEGGCTLSGGEKQRISIARAILKDAPIILLDEATASVDPDNEKYIQMAINELVKDKTLVVIAHRLATIRSADQILVIDEGKLLQKGTHDDLIEEKGQYNDFWERRMNARSWKINTVLD
ncbi:ABC transporter ATP-binding protein [Vallitalea sediminicola]